MKTTNTLWLGLVVGLVGSGCATETEIVDDLGGETAEDEAGEGKADGSGMYDYFLVRPDFRRCAWPYCGGGFVKRVNRATTTCADGSKSEWCYVAELDHDALGLDTNTNEKLSQALAFGSVVMRGTHDKLDLVGFPSIYGKFTSTEAWIGQTDSEPSGVFTLVVDNGVQCFTFPCPSIDEKKLNSTRTAMISNVDFDLSGASEEARTAAWEDIYDRTGVIVAGYRYYVSGPGGTGKGREATQFWTRAKSAPAPIQCYVGGCSSQICSDIEGIVSTCEWRPEYACYDGASCEVQADGGCGWTETPELNQCLASPAQPY